MPTSAKVRQWRVWISAIWILLVFYLLATGPEYNLLAKKRIFTKDLQHHQPANLVAG